MALSRTLLFLPEDVDNSAPDDLIVVASTPSTNLLINGRVRFTNDTALSATITAWAVPSGGTAGHTNICLPVTSIAANTFLDVDVPQIAAGGKLQAQSGTATSITAQCLDGAIFS